MTRAVVLLVGLLLAGCTTADPSKWLMYAKGNYLQGRLEAKGEALCVQPNPTPATLDYCAEAKATRDTLRSVKPGIEAELSKKEPDWPKIMQYLDLVLSLAAKAL